MNCFNAERFVQDVKLFGTRQDIEQADLADQAGIHLRRFHDFMLNPRANQPRADQLYRLAWICDLRLDAYTVDPDERNYGRFMFQQDRYGKTPSLA